MKNYNLEIEQAEIGQNGLATKAGWIKTYIADPTTREYLNANMEYIYFDVSVSAGAYTDAPELPTKTGFAIVRSEDGSKWEIVADHRGKTAYNTETRQPVEVDFMGDLPETLTLLEPKTEFDKWNGKKWVTDTEAQKAALIAQAEQEKSQRLDEANNMLTYLQDSIDTGLATDEEAAALQAWKKYRVLLNRVDTSLAPNIEWPEKP
ncbi:tail fiber assembly protein [Providencia stuartii]|uniref:Tail fiber assembly protein n=1 Tax=Providencia stuartii TaxID=588 RepID=A0AAJ1N223_PROST|nr:MULTISPECIES: tail fiber assembly protein [Providencia]EMA3643271.1 tail fiber assembly protein [Providencia stuartii]MBW3102455.1 tail fiber assembly protein [Providencia stuartii]MCB5219279.1 tail fiber assembly protein [Providencia stuartii]MDE5306807.1 tail fiber assembly protein [Providencia stuartii]MDE8751278.1 tail fiber assembly protein [Providencia thailandensis]